MSNESLQRILNIASARKIPIKSVETRQLNLMTNKATHQGIGMQVRYSFAINHQFVAYVSVEVLLLYHFNICRCLRLY